MPPATRARLHLRLLATSALAGLAITVAGPAPVGAEVLPAPAAASAAEITSPGPIHVPGPGTPHSSVPIPPEFLPPASADTSDVPADMLSAATLGSDFTGDLATRDAALGQLPDPRRVEVLHALDTLHSPVPAPDFADPSTHIVVLGNALPADGTVHPTLANRLAVAKELAAANPAAPVVLTGGRTEHGHVEAEAMRDWLVSRGMTEDRIILEDRAWSTVSNAWNTRALLPELTSLVVVTSESHLHRGVLDFTLAYGPETTVTGASSPDEPPVDTDPDAQRRELYQDALLWYLLPDHVIADGLPPVLGHGIARP